MGFHNQNVYLLLLKLFFSFVTEPWIACLCNAVYSNVAGSLPVVCALVYTSTRTTADHLNINSQAKELLVEFNLHTVSKGGTTVSFTW